MTGVGLVPATDIVYGIHANSMATEFDGATEYMRSILGAPYRSGDSQGTITAWIKREVVGAYHVIFASCDEGSTNYDFRFYVLNTNQLALWQRNNDAATNIRGNTVLVAGQWYHVALVSDGSAYALYINSVPETLTVVGGPDNGDWLAETTLRDNITIGCMRRSDLWGYFNGIIDDVRYYSQPLSQLQITDLMIQSRQGGA